MKNQMKKLGIIFAMLSLSGRMTGFSYANCGNNNGNGNGCNGNDGGSIGPTGPQGPVGNNGTNGMDGKDGKNGAMGAVGTQGPNHIDPRMTEARLGLDTAIRLYDGKRFQWQVYNVYSPSLHTSEDVLGEGRNMQFGVRLVFKLGKSYEEAMLETQIKQIKALEAALSRL